VFQLNTARLHLRDWVEDDWHLIKVLSADPLVTRYQTRLRLMNTDEECRRWLADAIRINAEQPRVAYSTAVVLRRDDRAIGWLHWQEAEDRANGEVSFGYALLPQMWRRGYMSEAVNAMLRFIFEVQRKESAYASCAAANRASAGVLEQAGMKLVERGMHRDEHVDIEEEYLRYRLERSEWRV
jgi:RimJ/RimL family protein N-acetyltransferase